MYYIVAKEPGTLLCKGAEIEASWAALYKCVEMYHNYYCEEAGLPWYSGTAAVAPPLQIG